MVARKVMPFLGDGKIPARSESSFDDAPVIASPSTTQTFVSAEATLCPPQAIEAQEKSLTDAPQTAHPWTIEDERVSILSDPTRTAGRLICRVDHQRAIFVPDREAREELSAATIGSFQRLASGGQRYFRYSRRRGWNIAQRFLTVSSILKAWKRCSYQWLTFPQN